MPIVTPGRLRVLLVGLGRAAALMAGALAERDDASIVAAVDPLGKEAEAAASLSSEATIYPVLASASGEFDLAIVATPTPTHVEVCTELLTRERPPPRVLCEKPLSDSFAPVPALLDLAHQRGVRLQVLFHYAFAPEVLAVRSAWDSLIASHGPPADFDVFFADPRSGDLPRSVRVLGSSWVDLGVNALSVLARYLELVEVEAALGQPPASGGAAIRFAGGTGSVRTNWCVPAMVKQTTIRFADGSTLDFDHTDQRAVVRGEKGLTVLHERIDDDVAAARYRRMVSAHFDGDELVYDTETILGVHRLLASGVRMDQR
ncbi:MAG: Gfo/Idh/MocA family oxidoreductase [Actinomycetota bacterium]